VKSTARASLPFAVELRRREDIGVLARPLDSPACSGQPTANDPGRCNGAHERASETAVVRL